VRDKEGKDLGKVDDLLIDEDDRKIHFMRVESGGFLGMGETKVFIPVGAITSITDVDVKINQSHEHVARTPRYDPTLATSRHHIDLIYDHYGVLPE